MENKKRPSAHQKMSSGKTVKVSKGEKVDLYESHGYDESVGRETTYSRGRGSGNPAYSRAGSHNLYAQQIQMNLTKKPKTKKR